MSASMHRYRSHTCGALRESDVGEIVRLSGWCHRIRDHGGVLFIDLRDHYGMTQCVVDPDSPAFKAGRDSCARNGWSGSTARCASARPAPRTRSCRPALIEVYIDRDRGAGSGRRAAAAGVRRPGIPGGDAAHVPLPRSAPREAARQHHEARRDHRLAAPAHEGAAASSSSRRRSSPRPRPRARATSWCRRACIPASSTRCRRRRSSSSSSS